MRIARALISRKTANEFVVWLFFACLSGPAFSANTSDDETAVIEVRVSSERIRMGTTEFCSISAFEVAMAPRSRSQSVNVEVAAETRSEIVAGVMQVLKELGFEDFSFTGPGYDGWFLYPPPADVDFDGCG
jgi:hypothetical protein